jgi:hypothetical protein
MSSEIQISRPDLTGQTLYALRRNAAAQIWNGSAFVTYVSADLASYVIAMAEQGTASGYFVGNAPVPGVPGSVVVKVRAGGSPAESDVQAGTGDVDVPVSVSGVVATVSAADVFTGVSGLSSVDDFYADVVLVFTSGPLTGIPRSVTSYVGSTRTFHLGAAFPAAPSPGDQFELVGLFA